MAGRSRRRSHWGLEILRCLGNDSKLMRTGKSMRFIFSSLPIWFFFLVCEPNLCPPPLLDCAKDMNLVKENVSGQCCPNWHCGNSFHILKLCHNALMYFDLGKHVDFCLLECNCENLVMPTCEVVRMYISIALLCCSNWYLFPLLASFLNYSKLV